MSENNSDDKGKRKKKGGAFYVRKSNKLKLEIAAKSCSKLTDVFQGNTFDLYSVPPR